MVCVGVYKFEFLEAEDRIPLEGITMVSGIEYKRYKIPVFYTCCAFF